MTVDGEQLLVNVTDFNNTCSGRGVGDKLSRGAIAGMLQPPSKCHASYWLPQLSACHVSAGWPQLSACHVANELPQLSASCEFQAVDSTKGTGSESGIRAATPNLEYSNRWLAIAL